MNASMFVFSAVFHYNYDESWWSSMFANIAAGLIASIILMFFTTAKDKTLSYYEIIYINVEWGCLHDILTKSLKHS